MNFLKPYLKYYDTQYWLRDPELLKERRELLTKTGRLLADVILEPVLGYDSKVDFRKLAKDLELQPEISLASLEMLFLENIPMKVSTSYCESMWRTQRRPTLESKREKHGCHFRNRLWKN